MNATKERICAERAECAALIDDFEKKKQILGCVLSVMERQLAALDAMIAGVDPIADLKRDSSIRTNFRLASLLDDAYWSGYDAGIKNS